MSSGRKALHILVVPFQAEGHVNGVLRLAQYVAAREGVVVTFGYPARFYHLALKRNRLETLLASTCVRDSKLRIRVVEDGLPREEEQSITPAIVMASLPIFQDNVKLLLEDLLLVNGTDAGELQRAPPLTCIISDTFAPWTQDLANAARLPRVDFWTSTAAVYSMGSRLSFLVSSGVLPLPSNSWVDLETKWTADAPLIEGIPGLPPFPPTDLPKEFVHAEKVTRLDLQFMLAAFSRVSEAHTILVHSLYELESPVFDALQATGLPIYAVGPFTDTPSLSVGVNTATPSEQPVPDTPAPSAVSVNMANRHECLRWLDSQVTSSVVYIALGTVAKLTPAQLHALALALEASKCPFLWVIRADALSCPLIDALPPGFLHRTVDNGAGLIVSWAPQTQVLAHPSIGAFISHCGWNSTLECMWEGVPMVACPLAAEQRSNARWIVDNWKIGVALERQTDGSFTQEAVEKALREVLAKDGVNCYRQKMLGVKEIARHALQEGGSSNTNIVNFLENLRRAQCK